MGKSDHAKAVAAIYGARSKIHEIYHGDRTASVRSKLEQMDDMLATVHDRLCISNNTMKAAVRSVGLNLRNGHFYGSPGELSNSLHSKNRRVPISALHAKPCLKHVKYCLVRVL